jgi:hypothetical protein
MTNLETSSNKLGGLLEKLGSGSLFFKLAKELSLTNKLLDCFFLAAETRTWC